MGISEKRTGTIYIREREREMNTFKKMTQSREQYRKWINDPTSKGNKSHRRVDLSGF